MKDHRRSGFEYHLEVRLVKPLCLDSSAAVCYDGLNHLESRPSWAGRDQIRAHYFARNRGQFFEADIGYFLDSTAVFISEGKVKKGIQDCVYTEATKQRGSLRSNSFDILDWR